MGGGHIHRYELWSVEGTTIDGKWQPWSIIFRCKGGKRGVGAHDIRLMAGDPIPGSLRTPLGKWGPIVGSPTHRNPINGQWCEGKRFSVWVENLCFACPKCGYATTMRLGPKRQVGGGTTVGEECQVSGMYADSVIPWGTVEWCNTHHQLYLQCERDALKTENERLHQERDAWHDLCVHITEYEGTTSIQELEKEVQKRIADPNHKWFQSSAPAGTGHGNDIVTSTDT